MTSFKAFIQKIQSSKHIFCLLYTSDAADERSSVDLGGRRIIKKKKEKEKINKSAGKNATHTIRTGQVRNAKTKKM